MNDSFFRINLVSISASSYCPNQFLSLDFFAVSYSKTALRSWLFLVCRAETHMFRKTFWNMSYYLSQILLPEPFTIWNHFLKSRILVLVLFPESVLIPKPFAIWRLHRINKEFRFSKKTMDTFCLMVDKYIVTYVSTRHFLKTSKQAM